MSQDASSEKFIDDLVSLSNQIAALCDKQKLDTLAKLLEKRDNLILKAAIQEFNNQISEEVDIRIQQLARERETARILAKSISTGTDEKELIVG